MLDKIKQFIFIDIEKWVLLPNIYFSIQPEKFDTRTITFYEVYFEFLCLRIGHTWDVEKENLSAYDYWANEIRKEVDEEVLSGLRRDARIKEDN